MKSNTLVALACATLGLAEHQKADFLTSLNKVKPSDASRISTKWYTPESPEVLRMSRK
ncbi:hypothetical protein NVP1103O_67 [Vibrio phage 1.103.O._10N.261.52.F2]|nr:hypothetical protein NVP1103O_67 [Vibrio phage 1.103.O._10N.261.52.F2]